MVQSVRKRWWVLGGLLIAVITVGFEITIMNVALPTIATELVVAATGALDRQRLRAGASPG